MRLDSPRWEEINPSAFLHEKEGLRELAEYLPDEDPFHVWANVEFQATDSSINEVDALVLTRSGLYVLELKHWQGEIAGDGTQWVRRMPNRRLEPHDNPHILANRKAKRLAGLIRHYARQQGKEALAPYVGAAVFLHARDMRSRLDQIGRQYVYGLDGHEQTSGLPSLKDLLLTRPRNPAHLIDTQRGRQIVELVRGARIRPSVKDRKVGQLLLWAKPFAEGVGWQDFLAGHLMDEKLTRRVRFYLTSRAASDEVPIIRRAAEREFRLLQGIHHPGIAQALDLVDHPWGPAVVFDHDRDSVRLDQWLVQHEDKMTLAQRLQLVGDLVEIIEYAHSRRLSHRALNPQSVSVRHPDRARPALVVTEWQAGGRLAGATRATRLTTSTDGAGLEVLFDDDVRRYQAPEAAHRVDVPGVALDVFSLGAIAYRIFTGSAPAATPEELIAAVSDGGLNLSAAVDGMPETLADLVYDATFGDPARRLAGVAEFRSRLEAVWEDLTAPEPEPVVDPLEAHKGDVLEGGLEVKSRLGSGATATALLATEKTPDGTRDVVLKVARDEQYADRLATEARVLRRMSRHWQVAALLDGPVMIGGRTTLVLESAGNRTLADELTGGRRLALDLLERWGRDLIDIVAFLEGEGVWHRDIKPANLAARERPGNRQMHLCIFDFSLAATAADQIGAGTPPYLDPFLGPPRRMRYDAAADRFSAAVTLFEMATGTLPRWGEGAYPATVKDEVTLEPAMFDPAVTDRLSAFFAKALARDVAARFDTAEEMADAWRLIFIQIPDRPVAASGVVGPVAEPLSRSLTLDTVGLTARARSALERLGVLTVGELLDYEPSALTRAQGVPDATRKEILAQARALRSELAAATPDAAPAGTGPLPFAIEAVCATLLPGPRAKDHGPLTMLLGQAAAPNGEFLRWLPQTDAATAIGQTQSQVSTLMRKHARLWLRNMALDPVRDEIVALLDARGAVMSAEELADALIAARGSYTTEPKRTTQAIGLIRAAVEAELERGGDARVAIHRFRTSDAVLVGREPDDPTALTTADDLLSYAVLLGRAATELAGLDPLPTRQRAVERLRAIEEPDGMPVLSDQRLLQLGAAASHGGADVNAQGQLYPVGMPAERALRLAVGSVVGQKLSADTLRDRVHARFPKAERLPKRPALDNLLSTFDVPLTWNNTRQEYAPRTAGIPLSSTKMATTLAPFTTPEAVSETDAKLKGVIERRGYLAALTSLKRLSAARRALISRLELVEVDVTAILVERLRAGGFPWEAVAEADNGKPADPDFRSLVEMVQYDVVPAIQQALAVERPVLLTEAAPLARYGQLRLLQELADPTRPRPAARLLLIPARRLDPVWLDDVQLPLTAPASQSLWLPDTWIEPTMERTAR